MADQLERQLKDLERQKARGVLNEEEYQARRATLINATPVAAEKKRGGLMKWGMVGCFGIFAAIGLFFVVIIVAIMAAIGPDDGVKELATGNASDVQVKIGGTEGLKFSGSVGSVASQRTIDGTVPETVTIDGQGSSGVFTAVIQKQQETGTLTVTLSCRGGDQTGQTTAAYGVVTVSCSP